eukprot:5046775-Amphidinium_carterae.1
MKSATATDISTCHHAVGQVRHPKELLMITAGLGMAVDAAHVHLRVVSVVHSGQGCSWHDPALTCRTSGMAEIDVPTCRVLELFGWFLVAFASVLQMSCNASLIRYRLQLLVLRCLATLALSQESHP